MTEETLGNTTSNGSCYHNRFVERFCLYEQPHGIMTSICPISPALDPLRNPPNKAMADDVEADSGIDSAAIVVQPFKPMDPAMNQMDGSPAERMMLAHSVLVYDVFKALILKGEEKSRILYQLALGMGEELEESTMDMEDTPKFVEETLTICRALSSLIGVGDLDCDIDAISEVEECYKSTRQGSIADLAVFLHSSEYYTAMLHDFFKHAGGLEEKLRKVRDQLKKVSGLNVGDLASFVLGLTSATTVLLQMQADLRGGTTIKLEKEILSKLSEAFDLVKGQVADGSFSQRGELRNLSSLVSSAAMVWTNSPLIEDIAQWVADQSSAVAEAELWDKFVAALGGARRVGEDIEPHESFDHNAFGQIVDLLPEVSDRKPCASAERPISEWLQDCAKWLDYVFPNEADKHNIFGEVAKLLADNDSGTMMKNAASLMSVAHEVVQAASAFQALGADAAARTEADTGTKAMKVLLVKIAAFDGLKDRQLPVCFSGGTVLSAVIEINNEIADTKVKACEAATSKLKKFVDDKLPTSLGGVDGRRWYDGVPHDASLPDVLETARVAFATIPVARISDGLKELGILKAALQTIAGVYRVPLAADLMESSLTLENNWKLLMAEGLLAEAFKGTATGSQLKAQVLSMKKTLKDSVWEAIQPALLARATAATKMRKA